MKKLKLNKLRKVIYKMEMVQSNAKKFGLSDEITQTLKFHLEELKSSYQILKQEV